MPIKDVFLPLVGEPSAQALAAIEKCVAAAADLGAKITVFAVEEELWTRPRVMMPMDVGHSEETGAVRSVSGTLDLLTALKTAASRAAVRVDSQLHKLATDLVAPTVAERARFSDVALVLVASHDSRSENLVEALLLESGRPLLLCPLERAGDLRPEFENVMIAWDHSARAARAIGDAMPILQTATSVRVVTATDATTAAIKRSGADLVDHLREHGVFASFETIGINGSSIGKVLATWAHAKAIDALVMGAYHHSRLNEIVWGGVTKTVIGAPPCWVMMSH